MFDFLGKREAGTAQLQENTYSFYFMQLQLSSFTITIFFCHWKWQKCKAYDFNFPVDIGFYNMVYIHHN